MYTKLGTHWASSLLGFVALVLMPIPIVLTRYVDHTSTSKSDKLSTNKHFLQIRPNSTYKIQIRTVSTPCPHRPGRSTNRGTTLDENQIIVRACPINWDAPLDTNVYGGCVIMKDPERSRLSSGAFPTFASIDL